MVTHGTNLVGSLGVIHINRDKHRVEQVEADIVLFLFFKAQCNVCSLALGVIFIAYPAKPTEERKLNWEMIDSDNGGRTTFSKEGGMKQQKIGMGLD